MRRAGTFNPADGESGNPVRDFRNPANCVSPPQVETQFTKRVGNPRGKADLVDLAQSHKVRRQIRADRESNGTLTHDCRQDTSVRTVAVHQYRQSGAGQRVQDCDLW